MDPRSRWAQKRDLKPSRDQPDSRPRIPARHRQCEEVTEDPKPYAKAYDPRPAKSNTSSGEASWIGKVLDSLGRNEPDLRPIAYLLKLAEVRKEAKGHI